MSEPLPAAQQAWLALCDPYESMLSYLNLLVTLGHPEAHQAEHFLRMAQVHTPLEHRAQIMTAQASNDPNAVRTAAQIVLRSADPFWMAQDVALLFRIGANIARLLAQLDPDGTRQLQRARARFRCPAATDVPRRPTATDAAAVMLHTDRLDIADKLKKAKPPAHAYQAEVTLRKGMKRLQDPR